MGKKGEILFLDRDEPARVDNLKKSEQDLLQIAYEYYAHKAIYGDYVLPSVFLSFKLHHDLKNIEGKVIKKSGDFVSMAIQDFEGQIRPIGADFNSKTDFVNWENLTAIEVDNIERFADEIEKIYMEKGYYPDEVNMLKGNIGLLPDGKVVLLDTNLLRQNTDLEKKKNERKLVDQNINIGIFYPLGQLRELIDRYRKSHK